MTGSAIADVGAAGDAKVAFEDGKLTIGGKAKAARGVGVGTSYTIDFNKLKGTVDNFTNGKVSEAVKNVTDKVGDTAKDLGKGIKDLFKF
ncbi:MULTISPECIES: hypothetical protein [unclassified Corallococcus]|uniref:hypothetical protein n=1 Tax=unclassified Corallococcus TaxID=2685029 RepID=UPI001A90008E|nr:MULTISPECIES: hypothetical protein [unclassified Corallococcus]MBN9685187.1 hypothetical protein [Corallococcus sp. NCSPR001]WAS83354.1 hypothetical protein O0N60_29065 [Corallococcus sp. NCRR]